MALTATQVKNIKQNGRVQKISDGGGLYMHVTPSGSRLWRMNYRLYQKQRTASFGAYPDVSLAEAREMRDEAKRLIRSGIDPVAHAKEVRAAAEAQLRAEEVAGTETFEALSRAWIAKRTRENASKKTIEKYGWLQRLASSEIGSMDPMQIEAPDILPLLERLEIEGKLDAGQRVRTFVGQVMRYGVATGRAKFDPTPSLRGAIASPTATSHAAIIDRDEFGEFLRRCDDYSGHAVTVIAMQLAPLVVLRSSEIRMGVWSEVDFDTQIWRVPQERMKGDHPGDQIVPLSRQAVALLLKLKAITGRRKFMFETMNAPGTPLAENTINQGYRRMGYLKNQMTLHGNRTVFSTHANEALDEEERRLFDSDWIERQLAHVDDSVRGRYNAAEYLAPRRRMMKWWSDQCDEMRGYKLIEKIKVHSGGWKKLS